MSIGTPGAFEHAEGGAPISSTDESDGRIITMMRQYFSMADQVVGSRAVSWNRVEERYRAYVDPDERNPQSGNRSYPFEETVIIPYSYALVQALAAYLYTLYTAQNPILQVQPRGADDTRPADMMELLLDHYGRQMGSSLLLYGMILDALKYGMGGLKTLWEVRTERTRRRVRQPVTLAGIPLGMTTSEIEEDRITYDGPRSYLCDPWLTFPDPRVPLWRVQDGAFVGEVSWVSWIYLKSLERTDANPDGVYEGVDEIPKWGYSQAISVWRQSARSRVMGLPNWFDMPLYERDRGFVLLEELWARVVPGDLGLGPGKRPELWVFTCANRGKIIRKERADFAHGKYPHAFIESSPDFHSIQNPGTMEIMMPLQDLLDWMFNSHVENVRKALNDMFLVDPQRIFIQDLLSPAPMRIIRLRPEYFGTNVADAVQQLRVADVTGSHINDVQVIFDLMQRVSAALDALMGVPSSRRRTASEATGTFQLAANRMKVLAQLMSQMGIVPWAQQQVALIQQYMDRTEMVKILGQRQSADLAGLAEGTMIQVTPEDIQGEFLFPIHDGSMPLDPVRMSETWQKILEGMVKIPPLMQAYDIRKVFERGIRALGVRNMEDFKVTPKVMPDQEVMQRVQQGSLIPAGAGGGAAGMGPGGMGGAPALGNLAGLLGAPNGGGPPPPSQ